MKKLFAMSLFALSTTAMFGGNIERNNTKTSVPSEEKTEQQQKVLSCYRFIVTQQVFVNNFPSNSIIVYNETGLYTESGALIKRSQLERIYISDYDSKTGKGNLFTFGYLDVHSENCGIGVVN
ncbi:hypothetical protein [Flavobacterium sp. HSC-61S13]|uniref:hypothetical protein n=1 Tax=Flavobacterium sp. HSC-61S13 TaxID=2910963 RepID=UPI00209D24DE|nr:hypothetical protein [Flavobacterium sp. HSC-61S13]MCP1994727.1 hypothetical protein [Flavobacterium sp. HSC-61S13]